MLFKTLAVSAFISLVSADSCAARYYQCGGANWKGATCCEAGSYCKSQNDYYYQCVATDDAAYDATTLATSAAAVATDVAAADTTSVAAEAGSSTSLSTVYSLSHSHSTVATTQEVVASSEPETETSSAVVESSAAATSAAQSSADEAAAAPSSSAAAAAESSSAASSESLTFTPISGGKSGTGVTTRYWDCCKPSCAWSGKADVSSPVAACEADGVTKAGDNVQSGCVGGSAYMCNNQQPFAYNSTLAFGFVAASMIGGSESSMCCSCVLLTFNDGVAAGKQMVAQITNTGTDLSSNHFDIAMPGGGVGIFNGCSTQWGASTDGWGQRYGGVSSEASCSQLPTQLQPGCDWRWDFLDGADNPSVSFVEVDCPSQITDITGCIRN